MTSSARVLCVRVPTMLVAVARRRDAALEGRPVAVLDGAGTRAVVEQVSAEARDEGVQEGMTGVQARATCPEICTLTRDETPVAEAAGELETLLRGISPQVDVEGDGVFFLGCRGLGRLYGRSPPGGDRDPDSFVREGGTTLESPFRRAGPSSSSARSSAEEGLLAAVSTRLLEAGWPVRLGLADTRFVAFAASVCSEDPTLVPPSGGRRFLASLPLCVLPMSRDLTDRIEGLGLRTVGEFADLPAPSVEARYGLEGIHFHRLARGEDRSVLSLSVPDESVHRTVQVLASSVEELERGIRPALESLLDEMHQRGRLCASLGFGFELENGSRRDLEVSTAHPSCKAKVFWDQLHLALSEHSFPDRVVGIEIEVRRERRGTGQQGFLFGTTGLDGTHPERLHAALGWLQGLYGEDGIAHPHVEDAHRPERRRGATPYGGQSRRRQQQTRGKRSGGQGKRQKGQPGPGHEPQPPAAELPFARGESLVRPGGPGLTPMLRLLDPPVPLEVRMERERLVYFAWVGGRHRVRAMVGPQRLAGEWWETPFERDYYETLTQDAGLFWLYYCRREQRWFLQGLFD